MTQVTYDKVRRVDEALVRAIEAPPFTKTWRPYSHADVIDAIGSACSKLNIEPANKKYSLSRDGDYMFAVWQLANTGNDEMDFSIGFRNSINKMFAIGICAGKTVYVCSNMMFESDFILFRKHSGSLEQYEIEFLAVETMKKVTARFDAFNRWHESLRKVELTAAQASIITVAAIRNRIFSASSYNKFHELYFGNGSKPKYEPTLYGWHGALTETIRDLSLISVHQRNSMLNRFINYEVPKVLKQARKPYVHFTKIREKARAAELKERELTEEERREEAAAIKEKVKHMKKMKAQQTKEEEKNIKVLKRSVPEKVASFKKCPYCKAVIESSKSICPYCGN